MPTNIRVIHAHDFIKANPKGEFNFEDSKKLLIEIALAAAPLGDYDIILDTRKTHSILSEGSLWLLAEELSKYLRKGSSRILKTAILCPIERFDYAAFFALCAQNKGFNVSAFISLEEAYEWLIADKT